MKRSLTSHSTISSTINSSSYSKPSLKRNDKKSAFTLIEILLVVVIIGILAAVAIPNLDIKGTSDRTKETVTRKEIASVQTQLSAYYMRKSKYPASLDALVSEKYLRKSPKDAWGKPLDYNAQTGEVSAKGPNGKIMADDEN